jgi:peptidoglycan/LPS O-acetylase OafA/YrhL
MARYAKFIVAAVAAAAVTAQAALSDGTITTDEWWKVALAAAGATLVFFVPNQPAQPASSAGLRNRPAGGPARPPRD